MPKPQILYILSRFCFWRIVWEVWECLWAFGAHSQPHDLMWVSQGINSDIPAQVKHALSLPNTTIHTHVRANIVTQFTFENNRDRRLQARNRQLLRRAQPNPETTEMLYFLQSKQFCFFLHLLPEIIAVIQYGKAYNDLDCMTTYI